MGLLKSLALIGPGLHNLLAMVLKLAKAIFAVVRLLLAKLCGRLPRGALNVRRDCTDVGGVRARPDPYIYSQRWLALRHLAYTWDNPDFALIDPATLLAVDNHQLQPHHLYFVRVNVHNHSIMAAIDATVTLNVFGFGAGTLPFQHLGTVATDIPGAGTAQVQFDWTTPATAGHNCLQATVDHPDDCNPLNNLGQHNTDIAAPASPTRVLAFTVRNATRAEKTYGFRLDSYRLSGVRKSDEAFPDHLSLAYLRDLQRRHDAKLFPVPQNLNARLDVAALRLAAGAERSVKLEVDPPAAGQGRQAVNVHVFSEDELVGGITAYVDEV